MQPEVQDEGRLLGQLEWGPVKLFGSIRNTILRVALPVKGQGGIGMPSMPVIFNVLYAMVQGEDRAV